MGAFDDLVPVKDHGPFADLVPGAAEQPRQDLGALGTRFKPSLRTTVVPVDPNKPNEIRPMTAGESLVSGLQNLPGVGRAFTPTKLPFEIEQERGTEPPPKDIPEGIANAIRNVVGGLAKPEYIALLATPAGEAQIAKLSPKLAQAVKLGVSAFFAKQGAEGVVQQAPQIVAPGKTIPERVQATLETGAGALMTGLAAKGVDTAIREPIDATAKPPPVKGPAAPEAGNISPPEPATKETATETPVAPAVPTVAETTPPVPPPEMPKTPTSTGYRPAIRLVGGDVVVGDSGSTHNDIITANHLKTRSIDTRGFVDANGRFTYREEAAAATGLPTKTEPGRLHSTDLPETEVPPAAVTGGETPAAPAASTAKDTPVAAGVPEPSISTTTTPRAETQPFIGMGHALKTGEIPETGAGGEKYGVSQAVREERAQAGQVEPVEPGQGINPEEAHARGQQLLDQGFDAPAALVEIEKTGAVSPDAAQAIGVYGERLAAGARNMEEQFGTDSPQYREAFKALSDWDKRSKKLATTAHKLMVTHQGWTDLDSGSFTGLNRAVHEALDREITPEEKPAAEKIAQESDKANKQAGEAVAKVNQRMSQRAAGRSDAEQRAFDAANKTVREAAVRRAAAETKARVADEALKQATEKVQADAAKRAADAANKTNREAAVSRAKAENAARVKQAARDKQVADIQLKAAQRAFDAAAKTNREYAIRRAKAEREDLANPIRRVWKAVQGYLDKGETDPDLVRTKIGTDLGMSPEKVYRLLAQDERTKYLMDDMWRKQQIARNLKENAKRWVASLDEPKFEKYLAAVPHAMFKAKVFGHAGVALGTHAPAVGFTPKYWDAFVHDYYRMWKMSFSPEFYERQMKDLMNKKNWVKANRWGLDNNPNVHEEYNSPGLIKWASDQTGMGSRGYSTLKLLRQDLFDKIWNQLPKTQQLDEVAWAIAKHVNHMTGSITTKAPPKGLKLKADMKPPSSAATALFAPRLLTSRFKLLFGDSLQTLKTAMHWDKASPGEKMAAKLDVNSKLWVAGTGLALLTINAGILSAAGSKQKINFTDPTKSDWMKFKALGMEYAFGNALLSMARFLPWAATTIYESGTDKRKKTYAGENIYTATGEFARSQLSPFAGTATDLALGMDYSRRPLPRKLFGLAEQTQPVPARQRAQGVKPYSWWEYGFETAMPIPGQEGLKEVWKQGWGMNDEQISGYLKALAISAVMGTTGGRLSEDWDLGKDQPLAGMQGF